MSGGVPWCGSGGEDSVVGGVLGCVCVCVCRVPRSAMVWEWWQGQYSRCSRVCVCM